MLIKASIVDDDEAFLRIFADFLESSLGFARPECFAEPEKIIRYLAKNSADLVIVDMHMPAMSGGDLMRRLRLRHPQLKMAALTGFDTDEYLNAALAAGADGFITKGEPLPKIRDRLLQIHGGDVALAPEAWRRVLKRYRSTAIDQAVVPELSKAEVRILELTTRGMDCKSIARTLGLSVHTVYAHNKRIFAKLGVNSRVAAAAKYRELAAGIIDFPDSQAK